MRNAMVVFAVLLSVTLAKASPEVQNLTISQDSSSRAVTIAFCLTEKAIVTMDILTNGVSIGAANYQTLREPLSPDDVFPANRIVAGGTHVWMWRPSREWPGYRFSNGELSVEVKAWSLDAPPDYMVIKAASRIEPGFYAKAADIPGGIKTAPADDAEAIAALTNDVYRKSMIILRKIPAAGVKWRMGSPEDEPYRQADETPHYVTLTNDFFVSIYPLTFSQARRYLGSDDNDSTIVKYNQSYSGLRGSPSTVKSWPADGYDVGASSRLATMRERTGFRFDLLTEAEWEYACRAGTEGRWNDDADSPTAVAWTSYTGGAKNHTVGLLKPNQWGLYDMHGLVQEWVLDQYGPYGTDSVVAPSGVTTNALKRILRGGPKAVKVSGSYGNSAKISTRSAYRTSDSVGNSYDGNNNGYGVRVGCPAALPDWLR